MLRRNFASLSVFVATMMSVACSEPSPVAPGAIPDARDVSVVAQAVPGCYQLSFLDNSLQSVSSLVVGQELVLKAHVDNCSGDPAQRGAMTFQYCSLKGLPPNDITRPDEAPSAACATGEGKWARLVSVDVNASGDALMNFGFVSIPRTFGFRFKYLAQGSGIASGVSDAADFTWTPIS